MADVVATIGAAGDYATVALWEASLSGSSADNQIGRILDEEVTSAANITFDVAKGAGSLILEGDPTALRTSAEALGYAVGPRLNIAGTLGLIMNSDGVIVRNFGLYGAGIALYINTISDGVLVAGMVIHGAGATAAGVHALGTGLTVRNSVAIGAATGLSVAHASATVTVQNCILSCSDTSGQGVTCALGTTSIKNSGMLGGTSGGAGAVYVTSGTLTGNNNWYTDTSGDAYFTASTANVDRSVHLESPITDYRWKDSSRALMDDFAGADLSGSFTTDIYGTTRDAWYTGPHYIPAAVVAASGGDERRGLSLGLGLGM